jgi:hypothetical protein
MKYIYKRIFTSCHAEVILTQYARGHYIGTIQVYNTNQTKIHKTRLNGLFLNLDGIFRRICVEFSAAVANMEGLGGSF